MGNIGNGIRQPSVIAVLGPETVLQHSSSIPKHSFDLLCRPLTVVGVNVLIQITQGHGAHLIGGVADEVLNFGTYMFVPVGVEISPVCHTKIVFRERHELLVTFPGRIFDLIRIGDIHDEAPFLKKPIHFTILSPTNSKQAMSIFSSLSVNQTGRCPASGRNSKILSLSGVVSIVFKTNASAVFTPGSSGGISKTLVRMTCRPGWLPLMSVTIAPALCFERLISRTRISGFNSETHVR